MNHAYRCLLAALFIFQNVLAYTQDPALPGANFGFNNMGAGIARKPGIYYDCYLQTFQSSSVRNTHGAVVLGAPARVLFTSRYSGFNGTFHVALKPPSLGGNE